MRVGRRRTFCWRNLVLLVANSNSCNSCRSLVRHSVTSCVTIKKNTKKITKMGINIKQMEYVLRTFEEQMVLKVPTVTRSIGTDFDCQNCQDYLKKIFLSTVGFPSLFLLIDM